MTKYDDEFWYGHDCDVCGAHCVDHCPSTLYNVDGTVNEICFACREREADLMEYWFDITSIEKVPSGDGTTICTEPVGLKNPVESLPGFLAMRREEFSSEGLKVEFYITDRTNRLDTHECRIGDILEAFSQVKRPPMRGSRAWRKKEA